MKQLKIRFDRTLQLVETIRKTQPPGGTIREDPCKGAGQVPGRLPISKPDVDPPPHQEHFRMMAVQLRDIIRRRLCFDRISKLQPAEREVEVVPFGIIQFSHSPGWSCGMRHANPAAATTSLQHKWIRANTWPACRRVQPKSHCACIVNAEQMEARNDVRFLEITSPARHSAARTSTSKELRLKLPAW